MYNYSHPLTAGWEGDAVVPYRDGAGGYGYVLRVVRATDADAGQSADAYARLLLRRELGAERVAPDTYVVRNGSFADAFRVRRNGSRVTVVNTPTADQLDAVHRST